MIATVQYRILSNLNPKVKLKILSFILQILGIYPYLFVPISSQGDPQQNSRLHASSSNHTTPNTLSGET